LAALGITVVSQPSFIYDSGDDYARQLGPDRADHLYRGRALLDAGVRIVGSTDRPLPGSPLRAVQTLVERRTRSGALIGPKEGITVEEAFATVTTHAAWIAGMEDRLGAVRPGYLADLTLLGANPLTAEVGEIAEIPVLGTVVDGQVFT
jgi:predicted amidohydrolase YtcJ